MRMAAPQQVHVRAAPLARALRTRVAAAAASASSPERALLGLSEPDLRQLAVDLGQQSYRGKQLHDLLYKSRAKQIQEFSHVPKVFREALVGAGWKVGRSPVHHAVTASDGTTKILLKLEDNRLIETVGIPVDDDKGPSRLTACVSSQVL
jgi:23S rRNA (adenine2503-C2)-methyltransferase